MAYEQFSQWYDRLMEDMPYSEWLHFARHVWEKHGMPRTVVDLGCGTGSLTVPLAEQGFDVTGIDLSEDMLAVANEKAERARQRSAFPGGGQVTLLQQDIREWEIGRPADAVISFCDCFNYLLEEEEIVQAFRRTYEALAPGGVFMFDMHTPYQLLTYAETQPFFLNDDDIAYIWTCDYEPSRQEIEHALTLFVRDGQQGDYGSDDVLPERFRRIEEMHVQRAYPLPWVLNRLRAAGFGEIECFGDFGWEAPNDETQRAFFIAKK